MAPHLTPTELDQIAGMRQQRPAAILQAINAARERQEIEPVQVWAIRRALKGVTHKRGRSETRPVLSRLQKLLCGRRLKRQWNLPGGSQVKKAVGNTSKMSEPRYLELTMLISEA